MLATSYDYIQLNKTRVYNVEDDAAGIICQARPAEALGTLARVHVLGQQQGSVLLHDAPQVEVESKT
jgi:hypothetical protein